MKKYKRANVVIPKITPSNFTIQLRKNNYRLIKHLEHLEYIPFRIKKESDRS